MISLLLAADPYGYFDDASLVAAIGVFLIGCGFAFRGDD